MAALVARHRNPAFRAFAKSLKGRGKPEYLIITAVMRKLIVSINAVVASGLPARTRQAKTVDKCRKPSAAGDGVGQQQPHKARRSR